MTVCKEKRDFSFLCKNLRALPSLKILHPLDQFTKIEGIALIGSSASGKTTLVRKIREIQKEMRNLSILKRYITRPSRLGDDFEENRHISFKEFESKKQKKEIELCWQRNMEKDRVEFYGFETAFPDNLNIYSANNDFVRKGLHLQKAILVVGVYAPDPVRESRLFKRSPDMSLEERKYRLGDSSDTIIPYSHILIENYGDNESQALDDIASLVTVISNFRT